jgi:2-oxoisovalerate dehydrogenase E1 component
MVDLLNACMKDEMRRDKKILVFGQDVADVSREEHLGKVKGKGGVFKVTWGLQKEFGGSRVYNSPLAEAKSSGARLTGCVASSPSSSSVLRLHPARIYAAQKRAATMRWCRTIIFRPVVVRTTYGGYIRGAIYHSNRVDLRALPRPRGVS